VRLDEDQDLSFMLTRHWRWIVRMTQRVIDAHETLNGGRTMSIEELMDVLSQLSTDELMSVIE